LSVFAYTNLFFRTWWGQSSDVGVCGYVIIRWILYEIYLTFHVLSYIYPLENRAECKVINGFSLVQYFIYHSTCSLGIRYFAYCAIGMRMLFVFRRVCLISKSAFLTSSCQSLRMYQRGRMFREVWYWEWMKNLLIKSKFGFNRLIKLPGTLHRDLSTFYCWRRH